MSLNLGSMVAAARPITRVQWDFFASGGYKGYDCSLSNNGLTIEAVSNPGFSLSTVPRIDGKWYFEQVTDFVSIDTSTPRMGIITVNDGDFMVNNHGYCIGPNRFAFYGGVSHFLGGSGFADGYVFGCAVDLDALKIWFAVNNAWYLSGNPAAGTNPITTIAPGIYYPAFESTLIPPHASGICTLRATLASFSYTPPSGFQSWEGW